MIDESQRQKPYNEDSDQTAHAQSDLSLRWAHVRWYISDVVVHMKYRWFNGARLAFAINYNHFLIIKMTQLLLIPQKQIIYYPRKV